jgi:hypothetical protein
MPTEPINRRAALKGIAAAIATGPGLVSVPPPPPKPSLKFDVWLFTAELRTGMTVEPVRQTFTLTFKGKSTPALSCHATQAELDAALAEIGLPARSAIIGGWPAFHTNQKSTRPIQPLS